MVGMVLGLIPARGGSKGIPGKNIISLLGRPLLGYTAEAALGAKSLDRVILSTDDEGIASVGRDLGLSVPFLRPAGLSDDGTPMLPVIAHALDWCAADGQEPDLVVLLQPTSPLRTSRHIDEAIAMADAHMAQTVVSVIDIPHNFTPDSAMVADGAIVRPFRDGPMVLRRQDKPRYVARNGPAILVVRASTIRAGRLYGDPTVGYVMAARDSIDIDGPDDLWLAEQYLRRRSS